MKNQYVGDVNDFVKYGLLRTLTDRGARSSLLVWMLTPEDSGPDGRKLGYLDTAALWRDRDPELFDLLRHVVRLEGGRTVATVANAGILPNTTFFSGPVPCARVERHQFIEEVLRSAAPNDLVFFDPDNGLEINSCPPGRRNSDKYLLWEELAKTYQAEHSVLVYQHFTRESREPFIDRLCARIAEATGTVEVLAFRTSHVVFLLAPQHHEVAYYANRAEVVARQWSGVIAPSLFAVA